MRRSTPAHRRAQPGDRAIELRHRGKRLQRTQIIHYPPQPPDLGADEFGVAPHTTMAASRCRDKGGLQVRDRKTRAWIAQRRSPARWRRRDPPLSTHWFASTPHRVINRSGEERFSIASFYDPDFAAIVDPRQLGAS